MHLLWLVLLPFLGAIPPLLVRHRRPATIAWAAAVPTLAALGVLAAMAPAVFSGDVARARYPWVPALGLDLSLRIDGLAWLFAVLVIGIGLLVQLYARYYMAPDEPLGRLYAFLMLFMGAMLGLVVSGNLLLLVVFWELTSLTSFLLIGYKTADAEARAGALTALAVTTAGGLALLGGVLLLGRMAGGMELDTVLAAGPAIRAHPLYVPALLLVLLGAFTKSAQVPFHFWLPRAMAAPTPVSAYLHSATMVKAGVFLLARLFPALAGTHEWMWLVGGAGTATLLFGAYAALWKHDLKGLLAYSTISHLGLITLLLGFSTPMAVVAAVFHVVNHATFKASLFMAAGIIDHETGTRDMRVLNGLWRPMPHTALLAIVAAAAMAGVPLLNGFLSKEMFFAEALAVPRMGGLRWFEPVAATLAGAMSVGYSLRFIMEVFFNADGTPTPRVPHEPPRFMRVPVEVLATLCVVVGIAPAAVVGPALATAAGAVLGHAPPPYSLAVWHGFNLPLLMSILALAGGVALYAARTRLYRLHDEYVPVFDGAVAFDRAGALVTRAAAAATRALENGSLQRYVALLVGAALLAGVTPIWRTGAGSGPLAAAAPDLPSAVVWGLLVMSALATTIWHRRRLTAVVTISAVGLLVSLAFVRLSAPDLAITQLLVEVVTILLLLLALHYLPNEPLAESSPARRWRDGALATAAGAATSALTWAILTRPSDSISRYYLQESVPKGGGTNVVNVILVDFRGFDTLGEVAVMAIAGLGVLVLLDGVAATGAADDGAPAPDRHPVILAMITRPLLPLALLVSVFLLLRGHDLPGGGFAAGLLTAVALIVQYMGSGAAWAERRATVDFRRAAAIGVLLAAVTGAASWLFGRPFLTSAYGYLAVPGIGKVGVGSALAFDIGVYLTVVGVVMVILERLGRLSRSAPDGPVPEERLWTR